MDDPFELTGRYVDILAVAETKLDDSFPDVQFYRDGYKKPFRLDISRNSGVFLCMYGLVSPADYCPILNYHRTSKLLLLN